MATQFNTDDRVILKADAGVGVHNQQIGASGITFATAMDRVNKLATFTSGGAVDAINALATQLDVIEGKIDNIQSALDALTHDPFDGGTTNEQEALAVAVWQSATRTLTA